MAPPSESAIDIAELLKPWFFGVENSSTITDSRGYANPMPAPPIAQPTITTAAGRCSSAVAHAPAVATITSAEPTRVNTGCATRAPSRPCTADAPDQLSAAHVRARPARLGLKPYSRVSR